MASKKKKKQSFQENSHIAFLKNIIRVIVYTMLFIFVTANIAASQYMPKIFFDLANGKKDALVQMVTQANDMPQFENLLSEMKNLLIENSTEIQKESNVRKEQIESLHVLLESNPESPEVLFALHLLYLAEKDTVQAGKYLQQARMIDPQIGR